MQKKIKKSSFPTYSSILIFIVILSQLSINFAAATYTYNEVKEILDDQKFFVFNLRFDSLDTKEDLENNEFIFNDKLTVCYLCIVGRNPENLNIKPLEINIISPSNITYPGKFITFGKTCCIAEFPVEFENDLSIALNEVGTWWISIKFNQTGRLLTWIYFNADPLSFKEDCRIEMFNSFPLHVYTNLEYQQLRAVKTSEESVKKQETLAYATIILAIFTLVMAIGVFLSARYTKKYSEEIRIDRRQGAFINIIKNSINPGINEFNEINNSINRINANNLEALSSIISLQKLESKAWKDFRREFGDTFTRIEQCLSDKVRYEQTKQSVFDRVSELVGHLHISNIRSLYNELRRQIRLDNIQLTPRQFFQQDVAYGLAELITYGSTTIRSVYPGRIYDRCRNDLLAIRNDQVVQNRIQQSIIIVNSLRDYLYLQNELTTIKMNLMEKYDIYDWDL